MKKKQEEEVVDSEEEVGRRSRSKNAGRECPGFFKKN